MVKGDIPSGVIKAKAEAISSFFGIVSMFTVFLSSNESLFSKFVCPCDDGDSPIAGAWPVSPPSTLT